MKPIAWIVCGFALTGFAAALENLGAPGSDPATRLSLYLPALIVLLGGQYCLWRGFRSGIAALWSGAFDRRRTSQESDAHQPADRAAEIEPANRFDADAAFAHFMEQRKAGQADPVERPRAPVPAQPARPAFGRRRST